MTNNHAAPSDVSQHDPADGPALTAAHRAALDAALEYARGQCGADTLEERKRDSLDFHEVGVWTIRDIVRHAFLAGLNAR
ncbi:MAG: hypothetical protein IT435_09570 [Phycisphaerales bacterium]|nr:hypothetical protein [Phycisphaerales bacterium]